jgi:putative ABC transport system permease protein
MWGRRPHERLIQNARFGLRQLRRNPGFTAVAVLTLALGIGANAAIFSVVYEVLLKPLPFPHPDQLVWVARTQPPYPPDWSLPFSGPNFLDLRDQNHSFRYMAAFFYGEYSLTGQGHPENVQGKLVTANFFKLLGVEPMLGRGFLPGEDQKGRDREVILSYDFWQREFGGKRDVMGKAVDLSDRTYSIVGVMPRGFDYPGQGNEIWVPLVVPKTGRDDNSYPAIARLKLGVTLAQAHADLNTIAHRLAIEYPQSNDKEGVLLMPLHEREAQFLRPTLLILLGAVGLVLLIACANVANLLLARGAFRQRELAVRAALGAGRQTLFAQLLVESLLLAVIGGAAGLLMGHWSISLLRALKPDNIPHLKEIGLSTPVLGFTFGVSILTGIVFGLVPALQITRIQLNDALKASGTSQGLSAEGGRTRDALVVAEVALSLVLLAGAGLLIRSFARFTGLDPGFDPRHLLRFSVVLPQAKYAKQNQTEEFYQTALARINALPGVESAAVSYPTPPSGGESDGGFYVEGHSPASPSAEPDAIWHIISPGYFHAMRTSILMGRAFTRQDTAKSLPVVVINQTLARHFFPHENPIGKRLNCDLDSNVKWWEIVGVAADQAYAGFTNLYDDEIYFPVARFAWPDTFVVRTKIAPVAVAPEIRKAVWTVDKDLPIVNLETMEQALGDAYTPRRFDMALLLAFSLVAVGLAAIGIYGVMSYSVAQRSREIGIRMALGAQRSDVLKLVVRQGMVLAALGIGIGIAGAFGLTRFLASMLYGVTPGDPVTFALVSLLLSGIAVVACYVPARRATKVNPVLALRYE